MRTVSSLLFILSFICALDAVSGTTREKEKLALSAAENWLTLVDAGNYEDSWDSTSTYFRGVVTKEQWKSSVEGVRKPLGAMISRKLKSSDYRTSLPGAPDGDYVVIQFETSFENKESAIETVTPMRDNDGTWRVSGYYIK
jgi:hypothetical protein